MEVKGQKVELVDLFIKDYLKNNSLELFLQTPFLDLSIGLFKIFRWKKDDFTKNITLVQYGYHIYNILSIKDAFLCFMISSTKL
jgi:hypothetical protein